MGVHFVLRVIHHPRNRLSVSAVGSAWGILQWKWLSVISGVRSVTWECVSTKQLVPFAQCYQCFGSNIPWIEAERTRLLVLYCLFICRVVIWLLESILKQGKYRRNTIETDNATKYFLLGLVEVKAVSCLKPLGNLSVYKCSCLCLW